MQAMVASRILVVEDDPMMCASIRDVLGMQGFDVRTSGNIRDACDALLNNAFDLVLLDIRLEDQCGFAVMDHLTQRALDTRVIVVTGHDSEHYAITALKKGAIDYLKKPVEPDALLASIERVLARLARRRELHLFESLVSAASTAVAVSDPDGRVLYTNLAYRKLMRIGDPSPGATGAPRHDQGDGHGPIDRQMREVIDAGLSWQGPAEVHDADGRPVVVWKRVDPVTDAVAGRTYGLALLHEMVPCPSAETGDEKFRNLAEMTSDWIWEVDGDGVYTYSNPVVEDVLGYRPDEIIGRTPFDFMPAVDARRVKKRFEQAMTAGEALNRLENRNRCRDGSLVTLETSAVPIVDADGTVIGYRGIDRDISDRKRAAARLPEASESLAAPPAAGEQLRGLLHICAGCKMIRDQNGVWKDVEAYIETHSEAEFSHGICPSCARRLYPEIYQ